jgi:hypothetical protein
MFLRVQINKLQRIPITLYVILGLFLLTFFIDCSQVKKESKPIQISSTKKIIEIKLLKIYTKYVSPRVAFEVTNKSDEHIHFCGFNINVLNSKGEFLGQENAVVQNLKPNSSIIVESTEYTNVSLSEIFSWQPIIDNLLTFPSDGKMKDAIKDFELKILNYSL